MSERVGPNRSFHSVNSPLYQLSPWVEMTTMPYLDNVLNVAGVTFFSAAEAFFISVVSNFGHSDFWMSFQAPW